MVLLAFQVAEFFRCQEQIAGCRTIENMFRRAGAGQCDTGKRLTGDIRKSDRRRRDVEPVCQFSGAA